MGHARQLHTVVTPEGYSANGREPHTQVHRRATEPTPNIDGVAGRIDIARFV